MEERNKAAARAVFDIWSSGDLDRLDDLVAPDVVHHDPYDPNGAAGLVGMKRSIAANRAAFPELRLTVEDQLADGDRVATRWTAMMAPGGPSMTGITIDRFENDLIVEAWRSMDMLGLVRSLRESTVSGSG